MTHSAIDDVTRAVTIQPGAVVSKVMHRQDGLEVTVFGFDAGEGLTETHGVESRARSGVDRAVAIHGRRRGGGRGPGTWISMTPGTPHALVAEEPTIMILTLLPP